MVHEGKPATERIVHPVYPGKAWGVDPLSFDSNVQLPPVPSSRRRRSPAHLVVTATADRSLNPAGIASVEAALRRAGFTPAGTTHFRGAEVTEEVRK